MLDINIFFQKVAELLGPQLLAILGLIVTQVILAVAVAIKTKSFDLRKLTDFFVELIIPKLLGWGALAIMLKMVIADYLPQGLGPGIADGSFYIVVATFAGSIINHLRTLGLLPEVVNPTLNKLGLTGKPSADPSED